LNGRLDTLEWHCEDITGPLRRGLLAFSSVTSKQMAFKYHSWCLDGETAKGKEEDHEDFLNAIDLEHLDWGCLDEGLWGHPRGGVPAVPSRDSRELGAAGQTIRGVALQR